MKVRTSYKLLSLLLALLMLVSCLAACDKDGGEEPQAPHVHVDYVGTTKLDMTSESKKVEATVKSYIDGDTTHFYVDDTDIAPMGVVKARYLAVDTPESTGRIEEWGKAAAAFTKSKLKGAAEIILESDTAQWNMDNNDRHLLWIWYKNAGEAEYRNLNIELLQSGYAVASNSGQNRYGKTCLAALAQAKVEKLYVHSGEKDPNYPYGAATEVTLKELRVNRDAYVGKKVVFEGLIMQGGTTLYIEQYDEEDGRSYGVQVYLGYTPPAGTGAFWYTGNRVRIVGSFQYAEVVNAYQVSGVEYNPMKPNDPGNSKLLEKNQATPAEEITDLADFVNGTTTFTVGEEQKTFKNSELALYTKRSIKGLTVKSAHTTANGGDNDGAISLTCEKDGVTFTVRTTILKDENNEIVTQDRFLGHTIDVEGIIDSYTPENSTNLQIQLKVVSLKAITIH